MKIVRISNGKRISIVTGADRNHVLSHSDIEMDRKAKQAVQAAVEKAEFCKKPIAKYDKITKKAYIQYADGVKKYIE